MVCSLCEDEEGCMELDVWYIGGIRGDGVGWRGQHQLARTASVVLMELALEGLLLGWCSGLCLQHREDFGRSGRALWQYGLCLMTFNDCGCMGGRAFGRGGGALWQCGVVFDDVGHCGNVGKFGNNHGIGCIGFCSTYSIGGCVEKCMALWRYGSVWRRSRLRWVHRCVVEI